MKIISDPSPMGDFFPMKHVKETIVLHFTAGYSISSANATLDRVDHIAVPYTLDVNGDVYHKFDKEFYAYHLGMKSDNPKHIQELRSVGIEIVNIGPVWLKNGKWFDYVGREWPASKVVVGNNRGAQGGVVFPDKQIDALIDLLEALFTKLPTIPRQVPKDKNSYQVPKICQFKGLVTHQMFRNDKYDMGTGFMPHWKRIIDACKLKEVAL